MTYDAVIYLFIDIAFAGLLSIAALSLTGIICCLASRSTTEVEVEQGSIWS